MYGNVVLCVEPTVCSAVIIKEAVTVLSNTAAVAMLCLQKCIFHVCKQIVVPRPTVYLDEHIPVRLHLGLSFSFVQLLSCHERHGIFFFHHALPMEFRNYLAGKLAPSCWYKIECPRTSSELQEVVASHWHLSQRAKTILAAAVSSVTVAHSLKKLFVKDFSLFLSKTTF